MTSLFNKTLLGMGIFTLLTACGADSKNAALNTQLAPLPIEQLNQINTMPSKLERNLITISDVSMPYTMEGRVHFVDGDDGDYLGTLNTGYWYGGVVLPKTRDEIISPETYFERGTRGKRQDLVVFYDTKTLAETDVIEIPNKRMTPVKPQGTTALSDDEKFLLIVNLTPATSLTVVDLDKREYVTEIETPGCTQVYPVGKRDFNVICGDGSFMGISLDEQGKLIRQVRREPVFDAKNDPVTTGGARVGNSWYHLSRQSNVHTFINQGYDLTAAPTWSLVSESEREDNWHIAGHQHLAIHEKSRRLYALMIQGAPETFEDPGTQVWVFDLDSHEKINTIELEHDGLFMNVDQKENPQLHVVGIDLQVPFVVVLWTYLTEGMDKLNRMATFSFDSYDVNEGELKRSLPKIGNFPNYVQPWQ